MKITSSNHRILLLLSVIVIFSLVLRLVTFLIIQSVAPFRILASDSVSYEDSARALLQTGRFTVSPENPEPQTMRTPGYPVFIAAVYFVFGENHFPVIIIQILLSVGTILLNYVVARALWGPTAALLSALLLALDPISFVFSQKLLVETLFTFCLMIAVIIGVCLEHSQSKIKWFVLLGVVLALATLIRPISYYLIYPVVIGFLVSNGIASRRWRVSLAALLIFVPWIALVGGWQLRNFSITGSWEFSHVKGINLLYYRASEIIVQRDGVTGREAYAIINASLPDTEGWSTAQLCDLYVREALAIIKDHPLLFVKVQLEGLAKMMLVPGEGIILEHLGIPFEKSGCVGDMLRLSVGGYVQKWLVDFPGQVAACIIMLVYLLTVYTGTAYALWRIVRSEKFIAVHVFVWTVVPYLLILSAGPEAYARFRVPIMPLLALYAGQGISGFASRWKKMANKDIC